MRYVELKDGEFVTRDVEVLVHIPNRKRFFEEMHPMNKMLLEMLGATDQETILQHATEAFGVTPGEEESEAIDRKANKWTSAKNHFGAFAGCFEDGRRLIFRKPIEDAKGEDTGSSPHRE